MYLNLKKTQKHKKKKCIVGYIHEAPHFRIHFNLSEGEKNVRFTQKNKNKIKLTLTFSV